MSPAASPRPPPLPRRPRGTQLAIITINGSFWSAVEDRLDQLTAPIVLVQEHRLGPEARERAGRRLARRNWRVQWEDTLRGDRGGQSSGVAILSHRGLDVGGNGPIARSVFRGRATAAVVRDRGFGQFVVYSAYFKDAEGFGPVNRQLLGAILRHARAHGLPWLVGGDMNNEPGSLGAALDAARREGIHIGPVECFYDEEKASFRSGPVQKSFDYFFGDWRMVHAVQGAAVMDQVALAPHLPVRLALRGDVQETMVTVLRAPPVLPVAPPTGPRPAPPDWSAAQTAIAGALTHGDLDAAFTQWNSQASQELVHLLGADDERHLDRMGTAYVYAEVSLATLFRTVEGKRPARAQAVQWVYQRLEDGLSLARVWLAAVACRRPAALSQLQQHARRTLRLCVRGHPFAELYAEGAPLWLPGLQAFAQAALRLRPPSSWCGETHATSDDAIGQWVAAGEELAVLAAAGATALFKTEQRERRAEWRSWVEQAMVGGAGAAHAFIRDPAVQEILEGIDDAGGHSVCPRVLLATDERKWAGHWHTDEDPGSEDIRWLQRWLALGNEEAPPMPELTPARIRRVSRSFARRTAAPDGWHPRHFSLLCPDAVESLIALFHAIEQLGRFPSHTRQVLVRLITAKRRPIGLFRAVFRLWAKCRRPLIRAWEQEAGADAFFNNAPERETGDAVWRGAVLGATSAGEGGAYAEFMWDLRKAYENIRYVELIRRALAVGFPEAILRISVSSYLGERRLADGRMVSPAMFTVGQAVIAGSPFAPYELKALLVTSMRAFVTEHPQAALQIHVDDFNVGAAAESEDGVTQVLSQAAPALAARLEDLQLPLAEDKATLVASTRGLGHSLVRALGPLAGTASRTVRKLGYDYSGGRRVQRGNRAVLRARFRTGGRKLTRIRRLHRMEQGASKLVFAGARPSAIFGAEVGGAPPGLLRSFAASCSVAAGYGGFAADHDLSWALCRPPATFSPEITVTLAPAVRYCREWWLATSMDARDRERALTRPQLVRAFLAAQRLNPTTTRWRAIAHSPVALALLAFSRAGWTVLNATTFRDRAGIQRCVLWGSPAAFQRALSLDMERELLATGAARLQGKGYPDGPELSALVDETPWVEPLRKLNRSKARRALSVAEKRCLRHAVTGRTWTASLLRAKGYDVPVQCPFCRTGVDSVFHRVWECDAMAGPRSQLVDAALVREALAAGPTSLKFTRALVPDPYVAIRVEVPEEFEPVFFDASGVIDACPLDPARGPVYVDGSAFHGEWRAIASAGFAAVQIANDGQVVAGMRVALPRAWPQSAAAAERLVIAFVVQEAIPEAGDEPFRVLSDCAGVVSSWQDLRRAMHSSSLWGGTWRQVAQDQRDPSFASLGAVDKVKAHLTLTDDMPEEDWLLIKGNAAADHHAKLAAKAAIPVQGPARHGPLVSEVQAVAMAMGRMLALWPSARELFGKLARRPVTRLGRRARRPRIPVARPTVVDARDGADSRGHVLWVAQTVRLRPIFMCVRCGRFAEGLARQLLLTCPGAAVAQNTKRALSRWALPQPMHPWRKREPLQGVRRWDGPELEAGDLPEVDFSDLGDFEPPREAEEPEGLFHGFEGLDEPGE